MAANGAFNFPIPPAFSDFNLFIRLCAASKRWRCRSLTPSGASSGANFNTCARLAVDPSKIGTATTADADVSSGEKALKARFPDHFDSAADVAVHSGSAMQPDSSSSCHLHPAANAQRKKDDFASIDALLADKAKSVWTQAHTAVLQAEVRRLAAVAKTPSAEIATAPADLMAHLRTLVAHPKNAVAKSQKTFAGFEKQWEERWDGDFKKQSRDKLAALFVRRDQWRRDYLYDRTAAFGTDHLRTCDVPPKAASCPFDFRYVLVEVGDGFGKIAGWLKAKPGLEWDGALILP